MMLVMLTEPPGELEKQRHRLLAELDQVRLEMGGEMLSAEIRFARLKVVDLCLLVRGWVVLACLN